MRTDNYQKSRPFSVGNSRLGTKQIPKHPLVLHAVNIYESRMVEHDCLIAKAGGKCAFHLLGAANGIAYHACTATTGKTVNKELRERFDAVIDKGHVHANGTARRLDLYASRSVSIRIGDEGICVAVLACESVPIILARGLCALQPG